MKFESNGYIYDVDIFHCGNKDIVRFYEKKNEQYGEMLNNLVIAVPSYGFLMIQYVADDAVLTGILNKKYFSKEMINDIIDFLESNIFSCRNIYLPYHIDFAQVSFSDEYNGEY